MKRRIASLWLLAALGGLLCAPAHAAEACPASAGELPPEALYGRWEARFGDLAAPADVRLAEHPEYAGSVRGTITRGPQTAQLSGDISDEGFLVFDESLDGRAISAVWSGEMQAGSCGKEFKGTWRNSSDDSEQPFMLRKIGPP
jgi:hypothetical protein